ncbi:hypothetical protein RQP46_010753 [Phenoliferia psychrophenolica]
MEVPAGQSTSDIRSFVALAKSNNVRPVVTVGGWSGSLYFSSLVSTYAEYLTSFANKWGFEGVDDDWEYPNYQGIADASDLLLFAKELKSKLASSMILTAAVANTGFVGSDGTVLTDVSEYAEYIDYLNIMNVRESHLLGIRIILTIVSLPGSQYDVTPLNACGSGEGADTAIALWTGAGFPANQILLSDTYTTSTDVCGVTTSGYSGHWEMYELISEGLLSWDQKSGKNGFTRYWDDCTSTPFLFNPSTKVFITYDDSESIGLKAEFAVTQGLAGLFVFNSLGFTKDVYSTMKESLGITSSSVTVKF